MCTYNLVTLCRHYALNSIVICTVSTFPCSHIIQVLAKHDRRTSGVVLHEIMKTLIITISTVNKRQQIHYNVFSPSYLLLYILIHI